MLERRQSISTNRIILDTGPLGLLAQKYPPKDISDWMRLSLNKGIKFLLSEVVDFELRRNFILHSLTSSIQVLDDLQQLMEYVPITTPVMLQAAELWATARRRGRPTADSKGLDCDVILAAQALDVRAIVVTENTRHLSQFVEARPWQQIRIE